MNDLNGAGGKKLTIRLFIVSVVSCLMAVSGRSGKWLTQISPGFLKACYYDYSLRKCADRE